MKQKKSYALTPETIQAVREVAKKEGRSESDVAERKLRELGLRQQKDLIK